MANAMHFLKPSGSGSTSASPMGGMPFANVLRSRRKQSAEPKAMADAAQEVSFLRNNAQAARGNDMGPPPAFVGAAGTTLMHTISTSSSRGGTVTDSIVELDTVTKQAPPHVALRYGDIIRLYARSKFVGPPDTGGYVGTYEIGKRFRPGKPTKKEGELACIPPIDSDGGLVYRPSMFRVMSTSGLSVGMSVTYGDVVVLVDERGQVWNNKIGVGPTTKNGYFGPRDQNTPGEMFLSFYQLQDDESESSSESSDDEESFLSFSNIAKTTKTMAETTFGKTTQADLHLASAAMRTMGKVVYYGDRNVIIDVADSNRIRSKFNRVITHYRKNDEAVVQGGYLRCDGRGKTILFEMHGAPLATIMSVDVVDQAVATINGKSSASTVRSTQRNIRVGEPIEVQDLRRSSVVTFQFTDGGSAKIARRRLIEAQEQPFFRLVEGGDRPMRLRVQAKKSQRRRARLRGTFRRTYRELGKVCAFVVVAYSSATYLSSQVFGSVVLLPALVIGVAAAIVLFFVEFFFPGKIIGSRSVSEYELAHSDWQLTILAIEASETERVVKTMDDGSFVKEHTVVPKSFLVAENGDATKAAERYETTLAWRKEVRADGILQEPQLHYSTIKTHYTQYLHKRDKLGHPVYFEKIGAINMKQLQKEGISQDDLFRHYLFAMEFTLKYAAQENCQCNACAASDTCKLLLVLDARGIGMRDLTGEPFEFIRRCTGVMQRHYPQKSFKIFFVNVPTWFGMVWKSIKPMLNEATRAKTNILTESEVASGLLEYIDADNLPVEYGGNCACNGGCEKHSAFQDLQQSLVDSVIQGTAFDAGELQTNDSTTDASATGVQRSSSGSDPTARTESKTLSRTMSSRNKAEMSQLCLVEDPIVLAQSIPPGSFRDEVLMAGFLLQRSLRHKHFNPIWHRRFFILHPDSLRFGKALDSEIFQIVSFTEETIVRKTPKSKEDNSFELITKLMASNNHSLLLYAPNAKQLNEWVDAISLAIAKLRAATASERVPSMSPKRRATIDDGSSRESVIKSPVLVQTTSTGM